MNITYDPEVDALSIRFQSGTASTEFDESKGVALGYDAEGRLTAIEVLDASRHFGDLDTLRQLTFDELGGNQLS